MNCQVFRIVNYARTFSFTEEADIIISEPMGNNLRTLEYIQIPNLITITYINKIRFVKGAPRNNVYVIFGPRKDYVFPYTTTVSHPSDTTVKGFLF